VREKVARMKQIWPKEVASFERKHLRLAPSWAWPKPVQSPYPPICLGGNGPLTMRHAAEWAEMWYPTGPLEDPTLARSLPLFKQMVADAGRDPASVHVGIAPGEVDAARLEAYLTNGLDVCNVAVLGGSRDELLANLDRLAATRDEVMGP